MTRTTSSASSGAAFDEKHGVPSEEARPPMAGLNEQEKEIINRQLDAPKLTVGYFALFRYAHAHEIIIMVIALIASIAAGATMPLMTVCPCPSTYASREHDCFSAPGKLDVVDILHDD